MDIVMPEDDFRKYQNRFWYYFLPISLSHPVTNLHGAFILQADSLIYFLNSWLDGGPWGYPNEVIPTGPNRERSQWRSSSGEALISFNIFLPSSIWIATGEKALTLHQGNIWGKITTGVSGPRTRYIVLLPDSCWTALSLLGSGTGKVPFNLLLWLQL